LWNIIVYNNIFNNTNNYCGSLNNPNYWNTTYQSGTNIWNESLGYIGGNLWTNPSNTGYSDNCSDGNNDGFCDSPYELNSNNIDYLPIAKEIGQEGVPYISVSFSYTSVDFGNLTVNQTYPAPNQELGIYNVTVDTNSNYTVKAYGNDFSGPETIPISNLYFDTNSSASSLSYSNAISLSTATQTIDTYSLDININYHGYWFDVPDVQAGDYTTTVYVIYETV